MLFYVYNCFVFCCLFRSCCDFSSDLTKLVKSEPLCLDEMAGSDQYIRRMGWYKRQNVQSSFRTNIDIMSNARFRIQ